ncbi:MAG TPA: hypothetical protein DEZ08_03850 [Dehalococcoidia bacterium]|nr:hypothetical protein [Dehalococcoidia bacterium]|tara:strand:- start:1411 stop:2454 length:1044 start_codon:yes stop_codon:yes gene_type:complete
MNKRMQIFPVVLTIVFACFVNLYGAPVTLAQEAKDIRGYVINETKSSNVPADLGIILHMFDAGGGAMETRKYAMDRSGFFEFENIIANSERMYFLTVEHEGFIYNKELIWDRLGDPAKISIYDRTLDPSVIEFDTHIMVIADVAPVDKTVSIVEFIKFNNISDKTLIPDLDNVPPISFVRFSVPDGFTGLDVQSDLPGGQVISVGSGFAVTSPIIPGKHEISFSYLVPYVDGEFEYSQNLLHGADLFQIMIPQRLEGIEVAMNGYTEQIEIEGTVYSAWALDNVNPGEGPDVIVKALPKPNLQDIILGKVSDKNFWRLLIPVILGLVLLTVIPLLVLRTIKLKKQKN